jgi:hypothetical protein
MRTQSPAEASDLSARRTDKAEFYRLRSSGGRRWQVSPPVEQEEMAVGALVDRRVARPLVGK